MVALEIADEAVRPDPDVATGLRCVEQLGPGVEKLHEVSAVRQGEVDGDPRRERTVRADIGLGVEDHDDGGAVVEVGVEVPPLVAAVFSADALAVLELRDRSRVDVKSFVIGGAIGQPKVAALAVIHGYSSRGDRGAGPAGRPKFWLATVNVGEATPILVPPTARDRFFELYAQRLGARQSQLHILGGGDHQFEP